MLCAIGWHKWGKWLECELTVSGLLVKTPYRIIGQERVCDKCGKRELSQ